MTKSVATVSTGPVLVLKERHNRSGSTKRYDIIRAEGVADVDTALHGLDPGSYTVVELDKLEQYNVELITYQKNSKVA